MSQRNLPLTLLTAAGLSIGPACGGEDPVIEPEPDPATVLLLDVAAPCDARLPTPTDLFRDDSGLDERVASCPAPADPIEAAIATALADDGAPLDSKVTIPFEGTGIDLVTLTASSSFSLVSTSSAAGGAIPPTLVIGLPASATSTSPSAWTVLPHLASVTPSGAIELALAAPLEEGGYYVAITTDVVKDQARPQKQIAASPATQALTGSAVITAGAFEGLDAAGAARLERERLRLAPALALLEGASPPIERSRIRSIQGFGAALGFRRLRRAADAYNAALVAGRFQFRVETTGGELAPADVYPPGTPAASYDQVLAFRRGTIEVPAVLGQDGLLRSDWATNPETKRIPFLISIPRGGGGYRVAIYLPGFGRAKQDARELANAFAGAPRAAVLGIDLPCHGDRSRDASGDCKDERSASEIAALVDVTSNGNPERAGADGVPDDSGAGFFSGDPRRLRDGQLAAIIEVMHLIETLQRGAATLNAAGLMPSPNDLHLVAHGHSAAVALASSSLTRGAVRTISLTSGGAKISELVAGGPAALVEAFDGTLPAGVTAAQRAAYLARLDGSVLSALEISEIGALANDRYVRSAPNAPRILLAHGNVAEHVPAPARAALITGVGLDRLQNRVSRHNGDCDDFVFHQCTLGDNVAWGERARDQLASFVGSGGVTVLAPAQ